MAEDKKNISDKIADLKTGVDWFYSDDFKLEEASAKYKDLTKLAKEICETYSVNYQDYI